MILDLKESKELCDWLMRRGLGLGECAHVLCSLGSGDSFAIALLKVFEKRKQKYEEIHAKNTMPDFWGDPITP